MEAITEPPAHECSLFNWKAHEQDTRSHASSISTSLLVEQILTLIRRQNRIRWMIFSLVSSSAYYCRISSRWTLIKIYGRGNNFVILYSVFGNNLIWNSSKVLFDSRKFIKGFTNLVSTTNMKLSTVFVTLLPKETEINSERSD